MIESTMQTGGAVLFWSIGAGADMLDVRRAFTDAGFPDQAPEYRAAGTVAGEALAELLGGPATSITPLDRRRGWFVAHIERGASRNTFHDWLSLELPGGDHATPAPDVSRYRLNLTWHAGDYRARDWSPPSDTHAGGAMQDELDRRIRGAYERATHIARPGQLTHALVDVVDAMGGTRLRPSGGLYWMAAGPTLDRFARLAQAIEAASVTAERSRVYIIRHALDLDALRAVRDAITAEIEAAAAVVRDQVAGGTLGLRGLASQEEAAAALAAKVASYEAVLGEQLPALAQLAEDARTSAAMAKLAAAAQVAA